MSTITEMPIMRDETYIKAIKDQYGLRDNDTVWQLSLKEIALEIRRFYD